MATFRRFGLCSVLFTGLVFPLGAQQTPQSQQSAAPAPTSANRTVLILFIGAVNDSSVQRLMGLITTQVSQGTNNVIIGISSGGGDTSAAFGVYNALTAIENQNPHTKITTINIGEVASAAVVIFCAGNERYSLPNANFMIHGNGMDVPPSHLEATMLKNALDMVNSLNEQTVRIISSTTKKNKADIEAAVSGQMVLTPQQAKEWNLIQDIRQSPAPPDATILTVGAQPEETKIPLQVTSVSETH